MKTIFNGKGKLWLAVLIALCAVVSACAVLACLTLFNKEYNAGQTANENTTTIQSPEHVAKPQVSGPLGEKYYFDLPSIVSVAGTNVASYDRTTVNVQLAGSATSKITITLNEDFFDSALLCEETLFAFGSLETDLPSECITRGHTNYVTITNIDKMVADKLYKIGIYLTDVWSLNQNQYFGYWTGTSDTSTKYIYIKRLGGQAQTPAISPSTSTLQYGETMQLTANGYHGDLSWSSSNPAVATVSSSGLVTPQGVGEVNISLAVSGDSTYNPVTVTKCIQVTRGKQGIRTDGVVSVVYNDSATLRVSGGKSGIYHWAVKSKSGGAMASLSSSSGTSVTITGTRAGGKVTVEVYAVENNLYEQSSTTSLTITIEQVKPTGVTASVQSGTYYIGNALNTVGINGSSANVSGTFAWTSPDTILTESGTYQWTFTPDDTTNYATKTGNLKVTAVPALDRIEVTGARADYVAYESFTSAGMVVTAYSNGTSKQVTSYTVTRPYDGTERDYFLVSDNNSIVTISYTERDITKTVTITITVNKATPTGLSATLSAGTYLAGAALSTVNVTTSNTGGVNGIFGWTDLSAKLTEGSAQYEYRFTPSDTTNYNVVTWQLTVYAVGLEDLEVEGGKATYKAYESYTTAGLKVYAVASGVRREVSGYKVSVPYTAEDETFRVSDNGCKVTITYTEGDITVSTTIDITVTKADYEMTGVIFDNDTQTYDPDKSYTIEVSGELPVGVTVTGYTYTCNGEDVTVAKNAGTYEVKAIFSTDDSENYNVPELTATLTINKATPTATENIADGTFYVGDTLSTVEISAGTQSVDGSLDWTNSNDTITGLTGNYGWTFTPDDTDNYNSITGTAEVAAYYKLTGITVTGAKNGYKAHESFDKTGMTVTASYLMGKADTAVDNDDCVVIYPTEGATEFVISDDGKNVTVSYTENGITETATVQITIIINDYDMTGVSLDDDEVDYNGDPHTLSITGNLPEGLTFKHLVYKNAKGETTTDGAINAGTYTVEAVFENSDPDNYNMPELTATLVINKATPVLDVEGVGKGEYVYTGEKQTVESGANVHNEEQKVQYADNEFTTVAEGNSLVVTVYVEESDNYLGAETTATITVKQAELTLEWTGGNGVYDGEEHNATLNVSGVVGDDISVITGDALNKAVTIGYTASDGGNDKRTNAGTYAPSLSVYPDGEPYCNYTYKITNDGYTFTIDKDSVGKLTFENVEVTYDGEEHTVAIKEELPDGVIVKYYITGLSTEFTGATDVNIVDGAVVGYKVTAKFSCPDGNYNLPDDMNAVLLIKQKEIEDENVTGIKTSYEYSGEDQTPTPVVKLVLTEGGEEVILSSSKDYKVKYSDDKLNAGTTVEVEVKGAGNYSGTITKSFEITKKTLSVEYTNEGEKFVYAGGSEQGIIAQLSGIVANDIGKVIPTITYKGEGATVYGPSATRPVEAGYYSVTVSLGSEHTNYESFDPQTKTFQIEQAELDVKIEWDGYDPDDAEHPLYVGGALPGIKVKSATFNGNAVAGTLSWVSESLSDKLTDTYTWKFVPDGADEQRNLKPYEGKVTLEAKDPPIESLTAEYLSEDLKNNIYVTTSFEAIKSYIKVTAHYKNGESGEIKGYSLTSDKFTDYPAQAGIYQLDIYYNGVPCQLDAEYKAVKVDKITVTARDPEVGIKTDYKGYEVLDRTNITVTAERNDGYVWELSDDEYNVEYATAGKDFFCVGDAHAVISYGEGSDKVYAPEKISVDVKKADFAHGLSFADEDITYDGEVHQVELNGEFLKGTISYQYYKNGGLENIGEGVTDAGEYEVWAVFTFTDATDKQNYNSITLKKSFVIEKAVYANVKFENVTADYNLGESLGGLVKVDGLPEGDEVKLTYVITNKTTGETLSSLDDIKNAGTYEITVKFTVDGNHVPLNDKKATVVINKLKPQVDPKWGGNLTAGTPLSQVLLEAGENEVAGTYAWKTETYELKVGLNRCTYVFTPDDTTNYEVVTAHMDLTVVGSGDITGGATLSTWLVALIIIAIIVCLIVAIIALAIALKKPKVADADGFYENASESDLTA